MFRRLKGVKLSYERQGFIRFACLTYNDQSEEIKRKILNLCLSCGADNWQALFEFMTTQKSAVSIAAKYFTSETVIYRMRKKFYHAWFDDSHTAPKKLPGVGLH